MMSPHVHVRSLVALKKYCANKDLKKTISFIDRIWDSAALNVMMLKTETHSLEELAKFMVDPDNKTNIQIIERNYTY